MNKEILGIWISDPEDHTTQSMFGNTIMEFTNEGELLYLSNGQKRDEGMILTYVIKGNIIITDQPSSPNKEETVFEFSENRLILYFDGVRSIFMRLTQ